MRKYLTVSLSACLLSATLVGCGDMSQEAQVSAKLEKLLDEMSRLQYADAPLDNKDFKNEMAYTLGKEVNGVKVPGSTRFEAAYLDQALALLPLAQEIQADGTDLQKQSANAIIGSIKTDEAAFLIDEAERSFQSGAKRVVELRGKLAVLREIRDLNSSVAGDGAEVIEAYRTGVDAGGYKLDGINTMQEKANESAGIASKATEDLTKYNQQIEDLRDKVAEYEALELKLSNEARSSQSTAKFDKLDQATAAAKEGEEAQSEALKVGVDAWIAERVANLAEFKRQRLDGNKEGTTAGLLGKLAGFLGEAGEETNIPSSSDIYGNLVQLLENARQVSGDDTMKAAAFMLAMSNYGTAAAPDLDQRALLVAAVDKRVVVEIGVIGVLEMKIAQIKLERQLVESQLAEIESDRKKVLGEFAAEFDARDAVVQAAGFDRMNAAIATLKEAAAAVEDSGSKADLELMSVYTLHARVLQQQSVSARLYKTALSSMAAVGPELLGGELHGTLTGRVQDMDSLLNQVATDLLELEGEASGPIATLGSTDVESDRGKVAARQLEVYGSLVSAANEGGGTPIVPDIDEPEQPEVEEPGNVEESADS